MRNYTIAGTFALLTMMLFPWKSQAQCDPTGYNYIEMALYYNRITDASGGKEPNGGFVSNSYGLTLSDIGISIIDLIANRDHENKFRFGDALNMSVGAGYAGEKYNEEGVEATNGTINFQAAVGFGLQASYVPEEEREYGFRFIRVSEIMGNFYSDIGITSGSSSSYGYFKTGFFGRYKRHVGEIYKLMNRNTPSIEVSGEDFRFSGFEFKYKYVLSEKFYMGVSGHFVSRDQRIPTTPWRTETETSTFRFFFGTKLF